MMNTATRTTWKNEPIDNPKRIDITLKISDKQFSRLKRGLIPHEMEDKWFIFCENEWLYFHRSWTGQGIFKTQLIKEQDGYSIKEFWAERNQKKYSNDDDNVDIETFLFLLVEGLLRIDIREIYIDNNIKSKAEMIKGWSNFGSLLSTYQSVDDEESFFDYTDRIKSALLGVAVGDALGVPVEFQSREALRGISVKDMIGYGTHNMPAGTFSDDSSLTFCLAEALIQDFDLSTIGQSFVNWRYNNYWTARGNVFDIGNATQKAIDRLARGVKPELAGQIDASSNGNGSLMRILPLLFYLLGKNDQMRFEIVKQVSSITHGHIRSVIACYYYLEFAKQLFEEKDKFEIYKDLKIQINSRLDFLSIEKKEISFFDRLLRGNIYELSEEMILSSGYVIHTLEASIWCLLTTDNFKDAVLKAVNLGDDSDTTGAVTGGLAGLLYRKKNIPRKWLELLARRADIEGLAERMAEKYDGYSRYFN